jgi:hypothetical protein
MPPAHRIGDIGEFTVAPCILAQLFEFIAQVAASVESTIASVGWLLVLGDACQSENDRKIGALSSCRM